MSGFFPGNYKYNNNYNSLDYIFAKDKDGTNLQSAYTTNFINNTTDLGTLYKSQYSNNITNIGDISLPYLTNFNTNIYDFSNYGNSSTNTITTTGNTFNCVSMSSDNSIILASSQDNGVYLLYRNGNNYVILNNTYFFYFPGCKSVSISANYYFAAGLNYASSVGTSSLFYYNVLTKTWNASNLTDSINNCCCNSLNGKYGIVGGTGNQTNIYFTNNNGQTWTLNLSGLTGVIQSCSISSTGRYSLISINGRGIYYSNNYGQNWQLSDLNDTNFSGFISMSSTGQYCFATKAGTGQTNIYYSINYGQNWTLSTTVTEFYPYNCISSTGQYGFITRAFSNENLLFTTNYGKTWSQSNNPSYNSNSISIDSTGQNLVWVSSNSNIYYSIQTLSSSKTNYDISKLLKPITPAYWSLTSNSPVGILFDNQLSISASGQYGLAAYLYTYSGSLQSFTGIYYTTDYGYSFSNISSTNNLSFSSVTISSNGYTALATLSTGYNSQTVGYIYYGIYSSSTWSFTNKTSGSSISYAVVKLSGSGGYGLSLGNYNSGTNQTVIYRSPAPFSTWSSYTLSGNITEISISYSGQYCLASGQIGSSNTNGVIYYSHDYGVNWATSSLDSVYKQINSIDISKSGQYCVATNNIPQGLLIYSIDYGITWNYSYAFAESVLKICISGSGFYSLVTTDSYTYYSNAIYSNSNPWSTWNGPSIFNLGDICISETGQFGIGSNVNSTIDFTNSTYYLNG